MIDSMNENKWAELFSEILLKTLPTIVIKEEVLSNGRKHLGSKKSR